MPTKQAKKKTAKKAPKKKDEVPAPADAESLPPVPLAPAPPRGLEDVDPEDLVVPRFQIVQPMSEEGSPGHFRDNISGEEYEELEGLVPLKWMKGRVYFLPQDEGGGLRCASDDRIRPADRIEDQPAEKCAGCPHAQWATGDGGKRIKPDCSETWTLLAAHEGVPYFLTFKSAAMKAVRRLLTQLKLQAQKKRIDLCGFQFDVRLELVKFDVGKAYLPVFEKLTTVDGKDYANYQSIYNAFAHAQPVIEEEAPKPAGGNADFDFGENEE